MTTDITIEDFINTRYRGYAIYTLESRGIPSFYDSLTNIQRFILLNTPNRITPTLSIIGDCFKDGYHHGDQSLGKSIGRLSKKYVLSHPILEGSGFFGNIIGNEQAAPRYTKIKINNKIYDILNKYKYLNEKNSNNNYDYLHLNFPIGLLTTIIGISVGYQTKILPRKFEEIENFLNGKKSNLKPHFLEFKGKISKYEGLKNVWILESLIDVDETTQTIHIKNLAPLIRYDSFITKLNNILDDYNFKLENKSKDNIDIKIKINENWEFLRNKIVNATKIIVKENIVFIKDGKILEYDCIEDYLIDFKLYLKKVDYKDKEYILNKNKEDLEFLYIKQDFYSFLFEKKRTGFEIETFMNKFNTKIKEKLSNIKLIKLNEDEVVDIKLKIKNLNKEIELLKKEVDKVKKDIENTDFVLHNNKTKLVSLINDEDIQSEIEIFIYDEDLNGEVD